LTDDDDFFNSKMFTITRCEY